ncbi:MULTISPECIES: hypothetical protein [Campylobacter]|uniref:hypothetical protein n=1 Tax=Campylobacter TaxID=194 RepID=UPI001472ACCA|nr:hypothetical protein [Campylobacter sp. RM12916]MBE3022480.1 hypothetical protein [Campylobacter sp. 7477a]MBE3608958.1 hypothetical protein [Campylobacter sp. RM12916]
MLESLLDNEEFSLLMKMHVYECIDFLLQNNVNFSIMANLPLVNFNPPLPPEVSINFNMPVIMFSLGGYTFESAVLSQEELSFEAGFGTQNFASLVTLPLGAIVQILVENSPVLINFSIHKARQDQTKKSMSIFMSNPNNRDLFGSK